MSVDAHQASAEGVQSSNFQIEKWGEFVMKYGQTGAVIGALALCFGCGPKDASTTAVNSEKAPSGQTQPLTSKETGAPVAPDLPANLQHDGYRYDGLSRTDPSNFLVTITNAAGAQEPLTGAQSVSFEGMDGGNAKFVIRRTGALESMGSEHVQVDPKGVTIVSTSPGQLDGTPIEMPANVSVGSTWKTDYKVTLPKSAQLPNGGTSEDHSTFKVVSNEKVTTKAGTFDALLVESNGNDILNGQPVTLHTKTWYVKDRGPVKIVLETKQPNNQTGTMTIEAAPDPASK